jgi:hypothetical protein
MCSRLNLRGIRQPHPVDQGWLPSHGPSCLSSAVGTVLPDEPLNDAPCAAVGARTPTSAPVSGNESATPRDHSTMSLLGHVLVELIRFAGQPQPKMTGVILQVPRTPGPAVVQ